ncbi:hypothetical protein XENOCAPTIV_008025 [Xenoophorus captivus]|uniref:Uncharacterized protein n=1 Tax=Xenoophorus captivus TaxID=1517983 RepID=A0ABV0QL59_9TELE
MTERKTRPMTAKNISISMSTMVEALRGVKMREEHAAATPEQWIGQDRKTPDLTRLKDPAHFRDKEAFICLE